MPKPVRYLIAALRTTVAAVCSVVLVASLVLWPRSFVRYDEFYVATEKNVARTVLSTGGPGHHEREAVMLYSTAGVAHVFGPRLMAVPMELTYDSWTLNSRSRTILPRTAWLPTIDLSIPMVTIPHWLSATIGVVGLIATFPRAFQQICAKRMRLSTLLAVTLAVAFVLTVHHLPGDRFTCLAIEAVLFGALASWLRTVGALAKGPRKYAAYSAAIVSMGIALSLIAYGIHLYLWLAPFLNAATS